MSSNPSYSSPRRPGDITVQKEIVQPVERHELWDEYGSPVSGMGRIIAGPGGDKLAPNYPCTRCGIREAEYDPFPHLPKHPGRNGGLMCGPCADHMTKYMAQQR